MSDAKEMIADFKEYFEGQLRKQKQKLEYKLQKLTKCKALTRCMPTGQ